MSTLNDDEGIKIAIIVLRFKARPRLLRPRDTSHVLPRADRREASGLPQRFDFMVGAAAKVNCSRVQKDSPGSIARRLAGIDDPRTFDEDHQGWLRGEVGSSRRCPRSA